MIYSNYHTHSQYCDGHMEPEDYIKEAIRLGFDSIGFTSHAPLPFYNTYTLKEERVQEYCHEIRYLKEKYRDIIQVYLGKEIDYIPGIMGTDSPKFKSLNLDYTIGSVHLIRNTATGEYIGVDESREEFEKLLDYVFGGDIKKLVSEYYSLIRNMLKEHKPDIIGHLDLLKKNNKEGRYFSENEEWYREEVLKTLTEVENSGAVLEVNTGGISRGYIDTFYPSIWILKECKELGIPIVLNSDAHNPCDLNTYFEPAAKALKDIGYNKQRRLFKGKWVEI